MRLNHFWMSHSGKEQMISWTQPDFLLYVIVSLVISIDQGVLTRWQRSNTSKPKLDSTGLWDLLKTIKPDVYTRRERFMKQ